MCHPPGREGGREGRSRLNSTQYDWFQRRPTHVFLNCSCQVIGRVILGVFGSRGELSPRARCANRNTECLYAVGRERPARERAQGSQHSPEPGQGTHDFNTNLVHQLPLEDVERGNVAQRALPPAFHPPRRLQDPAGEAVPVDTTRPQTRGKERVTPWVKWLPNGWFPTSLSSTYMCMQVMRHFFIEYYYYSRSWLLSSAPQAPVLHCD